MRTDLTWRYSSAEFSSCERYRYTLTRAWAKPDDQNADAYVAFIGLNPSTATEVEDDPTIRRCIGFAKAWGMGGLVMLNAFAYRSTDPAGLLDVTDPIGPLNDRQIVGACRMAQIVVAAWGVHGTLRGRDRQVRALVSDLHHLGLTKGGHPRHPLYLPKDLKPIEWKEAACAA